MNKIDNSVFYNFKNFIDLNYGEVILVWKWRNHPEIRKWMYNRGKFDIDQHLKFLESLKESSNHKYWLVIRSSNPLGVISIKNINENVGELGYYIAYKYHGQNYSIEFLYYSLRFIFEEFGIQKLNAYIRADNRVANNLNDLFEFTKELIKIEYKGSVDYYFHHTLSIEDWVNNIKNKRKIQRLLSLSVNFRFFKQSQTNNTHK